MEKKLKPVSYNKKLEVALKVLSQYDTQSFNC